MNIIEGMCFVKHKNVYFLFVMSPKLQKHSVLKLAGRIIPHKRDTISQNLLCGSKA